MRRGRPPCVVWLRWAPDKWLTTTASANWYFSLVCHDCPYLFGLMLIVCVKRLKNKTKQGVSCFKGLRNCGINWCTLWRRRHRLLPIQFCTRHTQEGLFYVYFHHLGLFATRLIRPACELASSPSGPGWRHRFRFHFILHDIPDC